MGRRTSTVYREDIWYINTLSGKHFPVLSPRGLWTMPPWACLAYRKHLFLRQPTCLELLLIPEELTLTNPPEHTHTDTDTSGCKLTRAMVKLLLQLPVVPLPACRRGQINRRTLSLWSQKTSFTWKSKHVPDFWKWKKKQKTLNKETHVLLLNVAKQTSVMQIFNDLLIQ